MSTVPQSPSTLARLASAYPGTTIDGDPDTLLHDITFDSRQVKSGDLFVALRGGYFDGHDYVRDAIQAGAAAVLVDDVVKVEGVDFKDCAVATVDDSRAALAAFAADFFGHPSRELILIGVTGTDGKTTTCFLLRQILQHMGISTGLITTVEVAVPGEPPRSAGRQTTPESVDIQRLLRIMRDAGAEAVVLETSSHGLATHRVDGCQFDIGVVTNVTSEHLDFHGSVDAYRAAKGSLLQRVDLARREGKKGVAILNKDDPGARSLRRFGGGSSVQTFSSKSDESDIRASDIIQTPLGYEFTLSIDNVSEPVSLRLPGKWNVSNALGAAAAAYNIATEIAEIARGLSLEPSIPGRMHRIDAGQPFQVIVDYAHTPEGLSALLNELRSTTDGKLLVLVGSAGERDIEKRAFLGRVAVTLSDFSVFSSEDPRFEDPHDILREIARGAIDAGASDGERFLSIEDRRAAIQHILERAAPGDTVVLAGKGHETSMIYGSELRPWNEAQIARDVLRELGHESDYAD